MLVGKELLMPVHFDYSTTVTFKVQKGATPYLWFSEFKHALACEQCWIYYD